MPFYFTSSKLLTALILLIYGATAAATPPLGFSVCNNTCPYATQNTKGGLVASSVKLQRAASSQASAASARGGAYRDGFTIKAVLNATDIVPRNALALITGKGLAVGVAQWNGALLGGVAFSPNQCTVRNNKRGVDCTQTAGDRTSTNRVTLTEIGQASYTSGGKRYKVQATIRMESMTIPPQDQTPLRILLGVGDMLYVDRASLPCTISGSKTVTMTCRM